MQVGPLLDSSVATLQFTTLSVVLFIKGLIQSFRFVGIWVFVGNLILKCGCCGYKKSVWVTSFENVGISEMWVFFCVGILISVLESKTNLSVKIIIL